MKRIAILLAIWTILVGLRQESTLNTQAIDLVERGILDYENLSEWEQYEWRKRSAWRHLERIIHHMWESGNMAAHGEEGGKARVRRLRGMLHEWLGGIDAVDEVKEAYVRWLMTPVANLAQTVATEGWSMRSYEEAELLKLAWETVMVRRRHWLTMELEQVLIGQRVIRTDG